MELMIFTCGDSFTAGDELTDDVFFKNLNLKTYTYDQWRRVFSDNEINPIKQFFLKKKNHQLSKEEITAEIALNRSRAYPAKLESILRGRTGIQHTVKNYAMGGASQEWINREIIDQYLDAKKDGQTQGKKVIFLVGITGINRIQYFDEADQYWNSIVLLNQNPEQTTQRNELRRVAIMHEREDARQYKWLMSNFLLKSFCQSAGIDLYFVESVTEMNAKTALDLINDKKSQSNINWSTQNLVNEFDIKCLVNLEDIAREQDKSLPVFHIGGHFTEHIHELAAGKIFNELATKYKL